jgi:hypothetical protein
MSLVDVAPSTQGTKEVNITTSLQYSYPRNAWIIHLYIQRLAMKISLSRAEIPANARHNSCLTEPRSDIIEDMKKIR